MSHPVDLTNHGRGWQLVEPFMKCVGERPGPVPGSVVLRHRVRVRSPIAGLGFDQMIIDDELKAELDAEREATSWRLVHVSPPDADGVHVATYEQTLLPIPVKGLMTGRGILEGFTLDLTRKDEKR